MYVIGYLFGYFLGGMLCGLIPMIIAFAKKQQEIGIAALVVSGIAGFIHPIASVISGIIFLIIALGSQSLRPNKESNSMTPQITPMPEEKIPTWKKIEMENKEDSQL